MLPTLACSGGLGEGYDWQVESGADLRDYLSDMEFSAVN